MCENEVATPDLFRLVLKREFSLVQHFCLITVYQSVMYLYEWQ